ncbi:hypothetical protein RS030_101682 [Cryptosporidium xiaoi]|uniref:Uncharacterized protein n=1 Tax=Cryptosporidium xiaoi TaxID=659607 RepID=A0AAV9Y5Y3_9CRYT
MFYLVKLIILCYFFKKLLLKEEKSLAIGVLGSEIDELRGDMFINDMIDDGEIIGGNDGSYDNIQMELIDDIGLSEASGVEFADSNLDKDMLDEVKYSDFEEIPGLVPSDKAGETSPLSGDTVIHDTNSDISEQNSGIGNQDGFKLPDLDSESVLLSSDNEKIDTYIDSGYDMLYFPTSKTESDLDSRDGVINPSFDERELPTLLGTNNPRVGTENELPGSSVATLDVDSSTDPPTNKELLTDNYSLPGPPSQTGSSSNPGTSSGDGSSGLPGTTEGTNGSTGSTGNNGGGGGGGSGGGGGGGGGGSSGGTSGGSSGGGGGGGGGGSSVVAKTGEDQAALIGGSIAGALLGAGALAGGLSWFFINKRKNEEKQKRLRALRLRRARLAALRAGLADSSTQGSISPGNIDNSCFQGSQNLPANVQRNEDNNDLGSGSLVSIMASDSPCADDAVLGASLISLPEIDVKTGSKSD